MRQKELISYSLHFTAFLVDSSIGEKISNVILFGSVARNDFSEESDIDIFIDSTYNIEQDVHKILQLYSQTKVWQHKGFFNKISLKIGNLNNWSSRREIISAGICLFGKFNDTVMARYYMMMTIDVNKLNNAEKLKVWRKLYGYKQKVNKKMYIFKGMIQELGGKKLAKGIFFVPMENRSKIIGILKNNKVRYKVDELWSDTLNK